jgi:DNA-directed RNA polymerase sigma subunit (sigma70/sigma32)
MDSERQSDGLSRLMTECRQHPLLTATEEWALAQRIERGDVAAKERLVHYNRPGRRNRKALPSA